MTKIVAVAIRFPEGGVLTMDRPARHVDLLREADKVCLEDASLRAEQGFLTSRGQYVDRQEAARIALEAGQIERLRFNKHELFSEDLW